MKKLSAVMLALMLCVSMSFAARGGHGGNNYGGSGSSGKSCSSGGQFGLGYSKAGYDTNIQGIGNVSFDEIAMRYWFSDNLGIDVQLGFGSGDINTRILVGAKLVGKIKQISSLRLYWLAGFNFGSYKVKGQGPLAQDQDNSILAVQGGVGAEYFIIPCLSVLTEMGIRYISVKPDGGNSVSDFGVFADWLPQAGVRFYF